MRLPFINSYPPKQPRAVGRFLGLNENVVIKDGEFSAMQNLSCHNYPAISSRRHRGGLVRTVTNPHGMIWKNGLFYVSSTKCYYNGTQVAGLTVTAGEKQLVGMGAYIVIFPDGKIYNTHTGEVSSIAASYEQSGNAAFEELSTDSPYVKISATGIDQNFKTGDAVTIENVDEEAFLADGAPATKVITDAGSGYIVVTGSIQNSFSGDVTMTRTSASVVTIAAEGIGEKFKVEDRISITGCKDEDLNFQKVRVRSVSANQIQVDAAMAAKTVTQTGAITFQYYFQGSDKTKILGGDLETTFHEGDVVRIAGCTKSAYNGTFTVRQAGTGYILIDMTTDQAFTQQSGLTFTRTSVSAEFVLLKRRAFTKLSSSTHMMVKRTFPEMDFVCEHDNRLWGCSSANHEIYASKLGDPTNWNCYEGISTDSYTATVGTDGDFTGIISHLGYVLFFKENSIHMMYGSKPSNFQLNSKALPGVRAGCDKSLQVINETLFYVGRNGVYAHDGAVPLKISDKILEELEGAIAGQQDGRYYLSCRKGGKEQLLCFDPKYQIWCVEDGTRFRYTASGEGILYYMTSAGDIHTITGDLDETVSWMMESGDLAADTLNQKYISKAQFLLHLDTGAEANIYFRYDDDPQWHRKGTVHSIKPTTYTLPIIAQRCSKFRWKIEGKGGMKLLAAAVLVEGGSELRGTVQSWHRR